MKENIRFEVALDTCRAMTEILLRQAVKSKRATTEEARARARHEAVSAFSILIFVHTYLDPMNRLMLAALVPGYDAILRDFFADFDTNKEIDSFAWLNKIIDRIDQAMTEGLAAKGERLNTETWQIEKARGEIETL